MCCSDLSSLPIMGLQNLHQVSTAAVLQPQNKHQHFPLHRSYRETSLWHRKISLRDLQFPGFGSPDCISWRSSSSVRQDWSGWPMQSEDAKNYIQTKQNTCWWSSSPLQESQRMLRSSVEPCEIGLALAFFNFYLNFLFLNKAKVSPSAASYNSPPPQCKVQPGVLLCSVPVVARSATPTQTSSAP